MEVLSPYVNCFPVVDLAIHNVTLKWNEIQLIWSLIFFKRKVLWGKISWYLSFLWEIFRIWVGLDQPLINVPILNTYLFPGCCIERSKNPPGCNSTTYTSTNQSTITLLKDQSADTILQYSLPTHCVSVCKQLRSCRRKLPLLVSRNISKRLLKVLSIFLQLPP